MSETTMGMLHQLGMRLDDWGYLTLPDGEFVWCAAMEDVRKHVDEWKSKGEPTQPGDRGINSRVPLESDG